MDCKGEGTISFFLFIFFFKQKTAYEMLRSLVGSEMCIRDRPYLLLRLPGCLGISKNLIDSLHLKADTNHGIGASYSVLPSLLSPAGRFAFVPPVLLAWQMFPLQATYSVSPFLAWSTMG